MKLLTKKQIYKFLKIHKIKKNDLVLIHGNGAIFNNVSGNSRQKKINNFWQIFINYFNNKGTLVVPSFTYSLTQKKVFNPHTSKSETGFFSETFRKLHFTHRTNHPIFSVCFFGKKSRNIFMTSNQTCFGKDSLFDFLFKNKAKLLCLGCSYNEITFTHFIEEKLKVDYRYNKKFKGYFIKNGKRKKIETNYFVRKMKFPISTHLNLKKIMISLAKRKKYISKNFGRFSSHSISTNDFFSEAQKKLKKDKYYLIG